MTPHYTILSCLVEQQLEVSLLVGRIDLSRLQLNSSLLTSYASALGLGAVEVSSASVSRLSVYIPYSKLLTEEIVFTFEGVNLDLVTSTSSFPLSPAAKLNASALSGSIIDENASRGEYAKDMDFVVAWIEQMISTVRFFFCACPPLLPNCEKLFLILTLNPKPCTSLIV